MRNTAVLCAVIMLSQVFCIGCGGTADTGETGSAAAVTAQAASEGNTLQSDGPASVEEPGRLTAAGQGIMPEGAVVNIYCLGEDFKNRVQDYVPGYEKKDDESGTLGEAEVRWHVYGDRAEYLETLEDRLPAQAPEASVKEESDETAEDNGQETDEASEDAGEDAGTDENTEDVDEDADTDENTEDGGEDEDTEDGEVIADDDRIDLFVADESFLNGFVNSNYTLDVVKEIGLKEEALADQFPYTREAATDENGVQKAVSWHILPGVFIYRRSIASEVLGTDDPDKVQEAVADWEKFEETAELLKEEGYYMLSGYDDAYAVYSDNTENKWVQDDEIRIDAHLVDWAEQARTFAESGYTHETEIWSEDWYNDHSVEGEVFGFFDSSWGVHFTLTDKALGNIPGEDEEEDEEQSYRDEEEEDEEDTGDAVGDYAACVGPEAFHHSGTWILAAAGTDNPGAAKQIMEALTCDPENMRRITEDIQEFTNTMSGMQAMCEIKHTSDVLGGQDPMPVFMKAARALHRPAISDYDTDLNLGFQVSMRDYIKGETSLEDAIDNFCGAAAIRYPDMEVIREEDTEEDTEDGED